MKISVLTASCFFAALALLPGPSSGEVASRALQPLAAGSPLGGALAEISGLAPAGASSVYAHNDEQATIFELDVRTGTILGSVSLGRPPVIGDFEAIVAQDGAVSLITSKGVIYEATIEPRRRSLRYRATDTGLGRECEIEGFAPVGASGNYFIACKQAGRRLVVYAWSRESGAGKVINLKLGGAVPNPDDFRASDIVHDRKRNSLLVLDSAAGAILEISLTGEFVAYWRLGGLHRQAEGLALLADGGLVVADEGKIGKGALTSAALTLYPPRYPTRQ